MKRNSNQYSFSSIEERFNSKFVVAPGSGCWLWTSPVNADGYGSFSVNKRSYKAHRFSYESYVGDIPKHLQLDHLCKTTICVNPRHLEAITAKENVRRSDSYNRNKNHCKNGHEFTESNTYPRPNDGGRNCRKCGLVNSRNHSRRNSF